MSKLVDKKIITQSEIEIIQRKTVIADNKAKIEELKNRSPMERIHHLPQ